MSKYLLSRSVRDTSLEEGCYYSFEELVDQSNPEIADFLVLHNVAVAVRDGYETASVKPDTAPEQPVKRKRGRPRKDSYPTRQMRAAK